MSQARDHYNKHVRFQRCDLFIDFSPFYSASGRCRWLSSFFSFSAVVVVPLLLLLQVSLELRSLSFSSCKCLLIAIILLLIFLLLLSLFFSPPMFLLLLPSTFSFYMSLEPRSLSFLHHVYVCWLLFFPCSYCCSFIPPSWIIARRPAKSTRLIARHAGRTVHIFWRTTITWSSERWLMFSRFDLLPSLIWHVAGACKSRNVVVCPCDLIGGFFFLIFLFLFLRILFAGFFPSFASSLFLLSSLFFFFFLKSKRRRHQEVDWCRCPDGVWSGFVGRVC